MPTEDQGSRAPEESRTASFTDEDIAARGEELDALRAQIQATRDERIATEQDAANALVVKQLDAEKERLLAELANEQRISARVAGSTGNSLSNAEEAMRLAMAQREGAENLIKLDEKQASTDTNTEDAQAAGFVPDASQPQVATAANSPSDAEVSVPSKTAATKTATSGSTAGKAGK